MKKHFFATMIVAVLLLSCSAFANDTPTPHIELNDDVEYELLVFYRDGPPVQPHAVLITTLTYSYDTKDYSEIKQIIDCFNSMEFTHTDERHTVTDSTYFTINLVDDEFFKSPDGKPLHKIRFCEQLGNCVIDDEFYYYNAEDLENLKNIVYPFRTKNDTKIHVNNEPIKPVIEPVIIEGRTLVQFQDLCDALGFEDAYVDINKTTEKELTITKDGKTATFFSGQNYMLQNGERVELDVGCRFTDNYVLIPVRAFAEYFDYTVEWIDKAVYIS